MPRHHAALNAFAAPGGTPLAREFCARRADRVARALIGCLLVRSGDVFVSSETEAYLGPHDLACHSAKGRTPRTEVMFGAPGHAYLYLVYGMHWCLNVTTGGGAAVLIRGVEGISGPGRLTRALGLDRRFYGWDLCAPSELFLAQGDGRRRKIRVGSRVGIDYAGAWAHKPLRYLLAPSILSSK